MKTKDLEESIRIKTKERELTLYKFHEEEMQRIREKWACQKEHHSHACIDCKDFKGCKHWVERADHAIIQVMLPTYP